MSTDNAILNFLNLNFGIFVHFNMSTYHDGFSLWNTSVTDYDVGSSSYDGDVVKEFRITSYNVCYTKLLRLLKVGTLSQ